MLDSIRNFFEQYVSAPAARGDAGRSIDVAAAVLLIEVARMDGVIRDAEREAVVHAVRARSGLTAEEAATLVGLAEEQARQATDYYQFTSLINKHFSQEQKERLIERMWQVAYADADPSVHEAHLVRKIADLLYVSHRAYIAAKLRASAAAGR